MSEKTPRVDGLVNMMEGFIFGSRWLQAPLYLGLIVAQGVYVYKFLKQLYGLVANVTHMAETEILLIVLGMIDVVMIANLLVMVIIGGYETFVSRIHGLENHPDQPEWLSHVDAGVLKVKLAVSLVTISSIHLLSSFINAANLTEHQLLWEVIIHCVLLLSALLLAAVDRLMAPRH